MNLPAVAEIPFLLTSQRRVNQILNYWHYWAMPHILYVLYLTYNKADKLCLLEILSPLGIRLGQNSTAGTTFLSRAKDPPVTLSYFLKCRNSLLATLMPYLQTGPLCKSSISAFLCIKHEFKITTWLLGINDTLYRKHVRHRTYQQVPGPFLECKPHRQRRNDFLTCMDCVLHLSLTKFCTW